MLVALTGLALYAAVGTTFVLLTVVPRKRQIEMLYKRYDDLRTLTQERFEALDNDIKAIYLTPEERQLLGLELPRRD